MSASSGVPLTITPEAAARIAELGMQKEFEQMVAHVREFVPDVAAIEVAREEPYDTDSDQISITAYMDRPYVPEDKTSWNLTRREVELFPPQVLEQFCTLVVYGRPDAR